MKRIVTFGEILGRLKPGGTQRLHHAMPGSLDVSFAGPEANVAATIASLGGDASFVTALPNNDLTDACIAALQSTGMASHIIRTQYGRLGLRFQEMGSGYRLTRVTDDREHSALSLTDPAAFDWKSILSGAAWLHVSGTTPGISAASAQATLSAVQDAKELGVNVALSLGFESGLWQWDESAGESELASRVLRDILPSVDLLIVTEEDFAKVLQMHSSDYPELAKQAVEEFPNLQMIATPLREHGQASAQHWGGMLFDAKSEEAEFAPLAGGQYAPYEITNVVDAGGAEDAFTAGLLFALNCNDYVSPADALNFAVAASCLAHSVPGEWSGVMRDEVDGLVNGSA
jgi:2-dehydro-3-deoxygluconokinase